jgi:hypothetical protein
MGFAAWKRAEAQIAKAFSGRRRIRISYSESVEDIIHPHFAIEVKYGKQIPKYCKVKQGVLLNGEYLLIPSGYIGKPTIGFDPVTVGYDLEFLQRGMAQAQSYDEDKLPILGLKPNRWVGFVIVIWYDDLFRFQQLNSLTNSGV